MDTRLVDLFDKLSQDLANLERSLKEVRMLMVKLAWEAEAGKSKKPKYLANQFIRQDGTFPPGRIPFENDDAD